MDLFYIVKNVGHDLRLSLMSIRKFASNLGRVVIACKEQPPDVGVDVDWINIDTTPFGTGYRSGFRNTMTVVPNAIEKSGLGEFLIMNDDFIAIRPVDLDKWPFYIGKPKLGKGYWRRMNRRTVDVLKDNGLPVYRTNFHMPGWCDAKNAAEARGIIEKWQHNNATSDPISIRSVLHALYIRDRPDTVITSIKRDPLFKNKRMQDMEESEVEAAVANMPSFIAFTRNLPAFKGLKSYLDRTVGIAEL